MSRRAESLIVVAVVLVSASLRLSIAAWNQEANDPHLPVIEILLTQHRLPQAGECWECFQPKLWYLTVAGILEALQIEAEPTQRVVAQLVNVVMSLLTLGLLWRLLSRFAVGPAARTMTFALFALNPKWIGISAQATNDCMAIFLSTLALFFAHSYFSTGRRRDLLGMALASILAALSKGNAILLTPIILSAFLLQTYQAARIEGSRAWKAACGPLLLFLALQLATVPFLGQYWTYYKERGSPFVTNFPVQPPPDLFEHSFRRRPGITSIAHGYFTFRFFDLLRRPRIVHEGWEFPLHRTSLWSQIYGRFHSLHFDHWPRSWQSEWTATEQVTRSIFILGLVPSLFLMVALARSLIEEARRTFGRQPASPRDGTTVLVIAVLAMLAFAVLYSFRYRDYSTMKAIFVLPALAGLLYLQASGLEWFEQKSAGRPGLRSALRGGVIVLVLLYVSDVAILLFELAPAS